MNEVVQIFISYADPDLEKVEVLYNKLCESGLKPWLNKKDILPGELREPSIEQAIQQSDFFIVCLSSNSISERGILQKEIKSALDIWKEKLDSDIYIIPVKLEECKVPDSLKKIQWLDLYKEGGWARLITAIKIGLERRIDATHDISYRPIKIDSFTNSMNCDPPVDLAAWAKASTSSRNKVNVAIICDRFNQQLSRSCTWEEKLKAIQNKIINIILISVPELRYKQSPASLLFSREIVDVIIVNWNALNDDPTYHSNITLKFFEHYIWDLEDWISQGGIILVEAQTASSELVERAYKVFTSRDKYPVQCLSGRQSYRGAIVYFNRKLIQKHPFLQFSPSILGNDFEFKREHEDNVEFVSQDYSPSTILSLKNADSNRLGIYNGWFTKVNREWDVLAYAQRPRFLSEKRPILICRTVGKKEQGTAGAIILSTMYPSKFDSSFLLGSIFDHSLNCAQYHFDFKQSRMTSIVSRFTKTT